MPRQNEVAELVRAYRQLGGFTVTKPKRGSQHWIVRDSEGRVITSIASTPGDVRSLEQPALILRRIRQERERQAAELRAGASHLTQTVRERLILTAASLGHSPTEKQPFGLQCSTCGADTVTMTRDTCTFTHAEQRIVTARRPALRDLGYTRPGFPPAESTPMTTPTTAPAAQAVRDHTTRLPSTLAGQLPADAALLWNAIREQAMRDGKPHRAGGRDGYLWTGALSDAMEAAWPLLATAPKASTIRSTVGEYLARTGQVKVHTRGNYKKASTYWVCNTWHATADSLQEARRQTDGEPLRPLVTTQAPRPSEWILQQARSALSKLAHGKPADVRTRDLIQAAPALSHGNGASAALGWLSQQPGSGLTIIHRGLYHYEPPQPKPAPQPLAGPAGPAPGAPQPVAAPASPTPAAPSRAPRHGRLHLDVLDEMRRHPREILSIRAVAELLGAPESSVSRSLRDWADTEPLAGINRVTRGAYVYMPPTEPEPQAAEDQQAAVPAEEEQETVPEVTEGPAVTARHIAESAAHTAEEEAAYREPRIHLPGIRHRGPRTGELLEVVFRHGEIVMAKSEDGQFYQCVPSEPL